MSFIFRCAADERCDAVFCPQFLYVQKEPLLPDERRQPLRYCPDVQRGFRERPDVLVASELPAPSPSFQTDVVGRHGREEPDVETRPNSPWFN